MSCASREAVGGELEWCSADASRALAAEERAVPGFWSRIWPIRLTTSAHEIVWMSPCVSYEESVTCRGRRDATYIRNIQEIGVKFVHIDEANDPSNEIDDLNDIEDGEADE